MDYGSNREPDFFPGFDVTSPISRWGNFNLNILYTASGEMTLAEIFNITEEEQYKEQKRKAVGFI